MCEFCGKQYKYFNPYQEHVALHTPMGMFTDSFRCHTVRNYHTLVIYIATLIKFSAVYIYTHTVPHTNIGTLGKYNQKRL